jgi:hypothetical protein
MAMRDLLARQSKAAGRLLNFTSSPRLSHPERRNHGDCRHPPHNLQPHPANPWLVLEPNRIEKQYRKELWRYRELFAILAWRDIAVRSSRR